MITLLLVLLLFIVMTVVLLRGNGASMIAGHNMKSAEERAKINEVKLCKDMGKMMLGITFSLLFFIVGGMLNKEIYFIIGTILMILCMICGLIYMNTGNRYEKRGEEKNSSSLF